MPRGRSASLGRDAARAGAIFTLAAILVVGSVELAIGLRAQGLGPHLPGAPRLDYSGMPHPLVPLGARFIASVLGGGAELLVDNKQMPTTDGAPVLAMGPPSPHQPERVVDIHALTNDDKRDARTIPSLPFTARTTDSDATREPADPDVCSATGRTVWYRFTPKRNVGLVAFTYGTDHDIALGVFREDSRLKEIGCDSDSRGNALFAFPAKARRSYLFQLTAPVQTGELVLHLEAHGDFELISRGHGDVPANAGISWSPSLSANGRYAAWSSRATNLVAGTDDKPCIQRDPNPYNATETVTEPCSQIYVRDLRTKRTEVVSVTRQGRTGNGDSLNAFISATGRYVAFESVAPNLSKKHDPKLPDIFVHDRRTNRTEWIAPTTFENVVAHPSVTDDGRYVAFSTPQPLLPEDLNGHYDVYVFDRKLDSFELVTVSPQGYPSEYSEQRSRRAVEPCLGTLSHHPLLPSSALALYPDLNPYISGDGRWVVFRSDATNLVPGDSNGEWDTFVRDRVKGRTDRVSVSSRGDEGDGSTFFAPFANPQISANGRYVVFSSCAGNLTADDHDDLLDAYWHDRWTGRTKLLSGIVEGDLAGWPSISRDGRYVAFESQPSDKENNVANSDVYRHDTMTGATSFVTLTPFGSDSSGWSSNISGDGRAVLFTSDDPKLARTNDLMNIFLYRVPRSL